MDMMIVLGAIPADMDIDVSPIVLTANIILAIEIPALMAAKMATTRKLTAHVASVHKNVHYVRARRHAPSARMPITGEQRVNMHVITVKTVTKPMDVYPVVLMVTIENTTPTNKVMNVSSVDRPVHLATRTKLVNLVALGTGELFVRIHVVSVQPVTNMMVVHLAVMIDITCNTAAQKGVMSVNGVIMGQLVRLSVNRDISEPRVRLSVQEIVMNVHQIQRARVV